jgi:hypothetical protein
MRSRPALLLSLLVSLLFTAALSADSGSWGTRGYARRFATDGELVFAADGRGLTTYRASSAGIERVAVAESEHESLDVAVLPDHTVALLSRDGIDRYSYSSSGALQLRSTLPLGLSYTMLASGTTVLAAAGPGGVTIWNPAAGSLATVGTVRLSGDISGIAFHHDVLYVAVKHQGVFSYTPDDWEPAGVLPVNAASIAVQGDTLYLAAGVDGLVTADISSDASPRILNRFGAGELNLTGIAVSGTRVYAAEPNEIVHVYDVDDLDDPLTPEAPKEIASIREPAHAMAAAGNLLFLSGTHVDPFGLEHGSGAAIRMYDTTAAGAARMAGQVLDFEGPVSGVATNGTVAWVVDPPSLRVIDVSSPSTPRELASLRVEGLQDRIKISGNRAIVYGRGDVQLFDISNIYKPVLLGVFHSFGRPPSTAAFAGDGTIIEGNPWSGFHVVDFDTFGFTTPAQIAGIKGHYKEIVGRASRAYIFSETSDFFVVDLAVRGEANVLGEYPANGEHAESVGATATHPELLLVSSPTLFRVLSLADPVHPADLFSLPVQSAQVFGSSSDTTYLAGDGLLTAVDLTNGNSVATSMTVRSPMQVAAADNGKVVVADRYGLRIFGPKTAPPPPPPPAPPSRRRAAGR